MVHYGNIHGLHATQLVEAGSGTGGEFTLSTYVTLHGNCCLLFNIKVCLYIHHLI